MNNKRAYRNQSDIFNLQNTNESAGHLQNKKSSMMNNIQTGMDEIDRKKNYKMNQKMSDRQEQHRKVIEYKNEERMKQEYEHKMKMQRKAEMMNELERRRQDKEDQKRKAMEEDKRFMNEQEAYLARRDSERNQLFDKIKGRGQMSNMREGHLEDPAGVYRGPGVGGGPPQENDPHNPSAMVFGHNEVSKAQKVANNKAYLNMLQNQIVTRDQFKKDSEEEKRRATKDALDQEMQAFKNTEMQKMHEKQQQKMMYKRMLDDQISQKNSTSGSIRSHQIPERYDQNQIPPQPRDNNFSYGNIGKPGYEDVGQHRPGLPPSNRQSSGDIMNDLYRGAGGPADRVNPQQYTLSSPYAQPTLDKKPPSRNQRPKVSSPYATNEDLSNAQKLNMVGRGSDLPPVNMPYYSRDPNLPEKLTHLSKADLYGNPGQRNAQGFGGNDMGPPPGYPNQPEIPPSYARQNIPGEAYGAPQYPDMSQNLPPSNYNEVNENLPLDLQNRQREMNKQLSNHMRNPGGGALTGDGPVRRSNPILKVNAEQITMQNMSANEKYNFIKQKNGNRGSYNILTGI